MGFLFSGTRHRQGRAVQHQSTAPRRAGAIHLAGLAWHSPARPPARTRRDPRGRCAAADPLKGQHPPAPGPNQQWKGALPAADSVKASGVGITQQDALGSGCEGRRTQQTKSRSQVTVPTGPYRPSADQPPRRKNVRPCRPLPALRVGLAAAPRSAMRGRRLRTDNRAGSPQVQSSSCLAQFGDNRFRARALRVARHRPYATRLPGRLPDERRRPP